MRELKDMKHIWDRPYLVDDTKFTQRFRTRATPLEEGLRATLGWYPEHTK